MKKPLLPQSLKLLDLYSLLFPAFLSESPTSGLDSCHAVICSDLFAAGVILPGELDASHQRVLFRSIHIKPVKPCGLPHVPTLSNISWIVFVWSSDPSTCKRTCSTKSGLNGPHETSLVRQSLQKIHAWVLIYDDSVYCKC